MAEWPEKFVSVGSAPRSGGRRGAVERVATIVAEA